MGAWSLLAVLSVCLCGRSSGFFVQDRKTTTLKSAWTFGSLVHGKACTLHGGTDGSSAWTFRSKALRLRGGASLHCDTLEAVEDVIANAGDKLVCLDFTASWCGPCETIAPVYEALSDEMTDVIFLKVDVDANPDTAQKYDVFQMPTFVFVRGGEVIDRFSGANSAVLRSRIEALAGREETAAVDAANTDAAADAEEPAAEEPVEEEQAPEETVVAAEEKVAEAEEIMEDVLEGAAAEDAKVEAEVEAAEEAEEAAEAAKEEAEEKAAVEAAEAATEAEIEAEIEATLADEEDASEQEKE